MFRRRVNRVFPYEESTNAQQTILRWTNPPLSVLDNRAATLTKLGNLPGALRDGRKMIHMEKTEVTVGAQLSLSWFTVVLVSGGTRAVIGTECLPIIPI